MSDAAGDSEYPSWWYDSARCMFVYGLYPIIIIGYSEQLIRDLADGPPGSTQAFAARLLQLQEAKT